MKEELARNGHATAFRVYASDHSGAEEEANNKLKGILVGILRPPHFL